MTQKKSAVVDMTHGPIARHLIYFCLPLLIGNVFQLLYNTVDTLVVGNFVSTQALAAVGSTGSIINMVVLFFNGFSIGGGVVIGQAYGAKDFDRLHRSIETTMAMTFIASVILTIFSVLMVPVMLTWMATPADVVAAATVYLRIYFAGLPGLLVYNMGSGILRAVGDTKRPLYFLILTSILNIVLDLVFVLIFKMGIAGVAIATILSELISAMAVLYLLLKTDDIYKLTLSDLRLDKDIFQRIVAIGLPAGFQSMITGFSNIFVQAYVNRLGTAAMAGWSCYGKLDMFVFLPIQSMAQASTTFVSQNIGAGQEDRANDGTARAMQLIFAITFAIAAVLFIIAPQATGFFSKDADVISYGVLFLRMNVFFIVLNAVNHVLAGALRGRGDAKGPMLIMITCFVILRQIYLFVATRIAYNPYVVGFGYPVGWTTCCIAEIAYYLLVHKYKKTRR